MGGGWKLNPKFKAFPSWTLQTLVLLLSFNPHQAAVSESLNACFVNLIIIQSMCDRVNKYLDEIFIQKWPILHPDDSYKTLLKLGLWHTLISKILAAGSATSDRKPLRSLVYLLLALISFKEHRMFQSIFMNFYRNNLEIVPIYFYLFDFIKDISCQLKDL